MKEEPADMDGFKDTFNNEAEEEHCKTEVEEIESLETPKLQYVRLKEAFLQKFLFHENWGHQETKKLLEPNLNFMNNPIYNIKYGEHLAVEPRV
jgi:hypothetical protein